MRRTFALLFCLLPGLSGAAELPHGNRLAYLDANHPWLVDPAFPRLTTPQWVGEPGIEAVVITNAPALPGDSPADPDGRGPSARDSAPEIFVTRVADYPYPTISRGIAWEFPSHTLDHGQTERRMDGVNPNLPDAGMTALDLVVQKQGVMSLALQSRGRNRPELTDALIGHAHARHPGRVLFLDFRNALARLTRNLVAGQTVRAADGGDNGVRLIDLDLDGCLDVVIGNPERRLTRLWNPSTRTWKDADFPAAFLEIDFDGIRRDTGLRFGVFHPDGRPSMLFRNSRQSGAWTFADGRWISEPTLWDGLEKDGKPLLTNLEGVDQGLRFRDIDGDGLSEAVLGNPSGSGVWHWHRTLRRWSPAGFALPDGTSVVNGAGQDNGLRFVDVNEDGYLDVLFSNETAYGLWLFQPQPHLGWGRGWTRKTVAGTRASGSPFTVYADEIPPFVRSGPDRDNGAWIRARHLWVRNEETVHLPDQVDRWSFDDLLRGRLPRPQSPDESLTSFRLAPGFRIEIVAAEPLVIDPVAFDWGADGRLWVVEMRDYPLGLDGRGRPGGAVKVLEDRDGDGRYDQAVEFLNDLPFPTGVMPWRNGILVSAAPDIFWAADTDGDGRADTRQVLVTGFVEGNQQHRVNGFALGLDGWVYGANGDSGGNLRRVPDGPLLALRGHDFRFRPDTADLEVIEGQTQFGRFRDDWGNWFGNANYTWLWHYPWPSHYLARNPQLLVRDLRWPLTQGPGRTRVYPVSRPLPRPNAVGDENTVTSACGATAYRDNLFGPGFTSSVFIAEPTENLVHREVLTPQGAGWSSQRAVNESDREFLASTDPWFRPVQCRTGPDGALYIADMYRLVIEHPEWIPPDLLARLDVRAGADRGRIYRVLPTGTSLRRLHRLDTLDPKGLVAALDSPNGWQRDTAMRLLLERRDQAAIPLLQAQFESAVDPRARLQVLATLGQLGGADNPLLLRALADHHFAVQSHALRLAEPWLRNHPAGPLAETVLGLIRDPNPQLAGQLAYTLGELSHPQSGPALASLVQRWPEDEILLTAVLSSASPHLAGMLSHLATQDAPSPRLLERLLAMAAARRDRPAIDLGLAALLRLRHPGDEPVQFAALAAVLEVIPEPTDPGVDASNPAWAPILRRAEEAAFDGHSEIRRRSEAIRLLAVARARPDGQANDLAELLDAGQPPEIQSAALRALVRREDPLIAVVLLRRWTHLSPSLRARVVEQLLSRITWTEQFLDRLEARELEVAQVGVTARQRLLEHENPAIRARSVPLFAGQSSDRQSIVDHWSAAVARGGNVERGQGVFRVHCASCHPWHGEGQPLGPDLGAVADKTPAALVTAILDPNRAVEDRYLAYTAVTRSGRSWVGLIASESPNSVTLRTAGGFEEVFARSELESLTSTGRSLMPEGFELSFEEGDLADLVAFLSSAAAKP